jgi:hypothetical protein
MNKLAMRLKLLNELIEELPKMMGGEEAQDEDPSTDMPELDEKPEDEEKQLPPDLDGDAAGMEELADALKDENDEDEEGQDDEEHVNPLDALEDIVPEEDAPEEEEEEKPRFRKAKRF